MNVSLLDRVTLTLAQNRAAKRDARYAYRRRGLPFAPIKGPAREDHWGWASDPPKLQISLAEGSVEFNGSKV